MVFLQKSEIIKIFFLEFSIAESSDWGNKMWWEFGIFLLFTNLGASVLKSLSVIFCKSFSLSAECLMSRRKIESKFVPVSSGFLFWYTGIL